MCITKAMVDFATNGVRTFRQALLGEFNGDSNDVCRLKDEMLNRTSSIADDRRKLRDDQISIYRDIHKSYNKILLGNV